MPLNQHYFIEANEVKLYYIICPSEVVFLQKHFYGHSHLSFMQIYKE